MPFPYTVDDGLLSADVPVIIRPPGYTRTYPAELHLTAKLDTGAAFSAIHDMTLFGLSDVELIRHQKLSGFGGSFTAGVYAVSLEFHGQILDYVEIVAVPRLGCVIGMNSMVQHVIEFNGPGGHFTL